MVLLDVGCGPGSITLDLATRVARVEGIDAAEEAIEAAERSRRRRRVTNAGFRVADVYRMPFDDGSFDVVFAHQVLQHLPDPVAALAEMRRVLRPGGLVAVRDADYGTMVHAPHEPRLDRWLAMYEAVARAHGGEPRAGRRLAGWVSDAGFVDLAVTTSTWTHAGREAAAPWRDLWVARLLDAKLGHSAIEMGLADRRELEELADGWRSWSSADLPFFAFLHGEVIGVSP